MIASRRVSGDPYLAEWAMLNEHEQCLFELWLAGTIPQSFYDVRCRQINDAFAALEARRLTRTT